jgi:hypothetical protein
MRAKISLSDIGEPVVLPVSARQIAQLSRWTPPADRIWEDVRYLAIRFLACDRSDRTEWVIAWHHLVHAVVNLPRPLCPSPLNLEGRHAGVHHDPPGFTFPDYPQSPKDVMCDDTSTWAHLTAMQGMGLWTATILLSCIWPNRHVIMDPHSVQASVGLVYGNWVRNSGLDNASIRGIHASHDTEWDFYGKWLRPTILATAENASFSPLDVERALHYLGRKVNRILSDAMYGDKWSWRLYQDEAQRQLATLA